MLRSLHIECNGVPCHYSILAKISNLKNGHQLLVGRDTITTRIEQCDLFSDRDLLLQAFANVLDNAIKFTPAKGSVGVMLSTAQNEVVFTVCDTVIGIEEVDREFVIRRFFRVDKSRSTAGNGLGMALVAAVVKLHLGRLMLEGNPLSYRLPGLCCKLIFPSSEAT